MDVVQTLCPCATCAPLSTQDEDAAWEALSAALERADALGAGCGLGQGPMAAALMERLLRFLHGRALPCVLDADALNLLARRPAWLADGAAHVLTPPPGGGRPAAGRIHGGDSRGYAGRGGAHPA